MQNKSKGHTECSMFLGTSPGEDGLSRKSVQGPAAGSGRTGRRHQAAAWGRRDTACEQTKKTEPEQSLRGGCRCSLVWHESGIQSEPGSPGRRGSVSTQRCSSQLLQGEGVWGVFGASVVSLRTRGRGGRLRLPPASRPALPVTVSRASEAPRLRDSWVWKP